MQMRDISRQVKDMRSKMEEDEQLSSLMAGLRGTNINDSDFADAQVVMKLVEVMNDAEDQLPLAYDPAAISECDPSKCSFCSGDVDFLIMLPTMGFLRLKS